MTMPPSEAKPMKPMQMPPDAALAAGLRDIAKQSNLSGGQLLNPDAAEQWLEMCASRFAHLVELDKADLQMGPLQWVDPGIESMRSINADLLAALSALLNCVDGQHDQEWLDRCKADALAALARAEGK